MKLFGLGIWALVIGYLIGYYFRGLGNMTVGKLVGSGS